MSRDSSKTQETRATRNLSKRKKTPLLLSSIIPLIALRLWLTNQQQKIAPLHSTAHFQAKHKFESDNTVSPEPEIISAQTKSRAKARKEKRRNNGSDKKSKTAKNLNELDFIQLSSNNDFSTDNQTKMKKATSGATFASAALLPIYVTNSSSGTMGITSWGTLASQWNRNTTYADIMKLASLVPNYPPIPNNNRVVVILHCGPKTGSTTLRRACRINLEQTCGIPKNASKNNYPLGYQDTDVIFPVIRKCNHTHHFCAKNITMPLEIDKFENATFLHMFPFRNYDEWAKSALKQQYDRGREKECARNEQRLNKCQHSRMELDFRKYGKTDLGYFKELVVQRAHEMNEMHHFLLYNFRELNDILDKLSEVYGIPKLPGSDDNKKEKRPEGSCDESLLRKFHDCFSSKLMEIK